MTPHEARLLLYGAIIVLDIVAIDWTIGKIAECVRENRTCRRQRV